MNEPASTAHLSDDEQVLLHFGEEEGLDRRAAETHLASCAACRDARDRLAEVLALVAAHGDVEPPDGFERVMWARVGAALDARTAKPAWRAWLAPPRLAMAATLAAMLVAAFLAGRWSGEPAPGAAPAAGGTTAGAAAPASVLLVAVGDHLDRSQIVLVELLNADADVPVPAGERARAADLVAASRLIRQSAVQAGEATLADVLDELERVLIEIANGSGDTGAEIEALKARIESRGILFRMRVVKAAIGRQPAAVGTES